MEEYGAVEESTVAPRRWQLTVDGTLITEKRRPS